MPVLGNAPVAILVFAKKVQMVLEDFQQLTNAPMRMGDEMDTGVRRMLAAKNFGGGHFQQK